MLIEQTNGASMSPSSFLDAMFQLLQSLDFAAIQLNDMVSVFLVNCAMLAFIKCFLAKGGSPFEVCLEDPVLVRTEQYNGVSLG